MPSLKHAALVEMFRMHPELIPQLLREVFHLTIPAYTTLAVSDATLDQVTPTEFRADLVIELFDGADKRPIFSTIVEVQLSIDDDKRYAWPAYMIVKRARQRCETCVLVIAPDPQVAAWARKPIRIGPGNELRVLVLGPAEIPTVTDKDVALGNPEMAVLSALAHGNEPEIGLPVLRVALEALYTLDNKDTEIYLHLIYKALAEPMRRALRNEVMLHIDIPEDELEPRFLYEYIEARAEARMLLKILDHRGVELTAEQRETVKTCQDRTLLAHWLDQIFTAKTAAELFA